MFCNIFFDFVHFVEAETHFHYIKKNGVADAQNRRELSRYAEWTRHVLQHEWRDVVGKLIKFLT